MEPLVCTKDDEPKFALPLDSPSDVPQSQASQSGYVIIGNLIGGNLVPYSFVAKIANPIPKADQAVALAANGNANKKLPQPPNAEDAIAADAADISPATWNPARTNSIIAVGIRNEFHRNDIT